MNRIVGPDAGFLRSTGAVGSAPVPGIPSRAPDTCRPCLRNGVTVPAHVVAVPLASMRARLAPRRNRLVREPLLRIAADYSVSIPPLGRDEWDALWSRRPRGSSRRSTGAAFASRGIWVT